MTRPDKPRQGRSILDMTRQGCELIWLGAVEHVPTGAGRVVTSASLRDKKSPGLRRGGGPERKGPGSMGAVLLRDGSLGWEV